MWHHYADITSRIPEPPQWWDERAVPRYVAFAPGEVADIYADEVALVEIACQDCGQRFRVAVSTSRGRRIMGPWRRTVAEAIRDGSLHYGDPPNTSCCAAGATMNCDDLRVLEYWRRDGVDWWTREAALEIALADGPTPDQEG